MYKYLYFFTVSDLFLSMCKATAIPIAAGSTFGPILAEDSLGIDCLQSTSSCLLLVHCCWHHTRSKQISQFSHSMCIKAGWASCTGTMDESLAHFGLVTGMLGNIRTAVLSELCLTVGKTAVVTVLKAIKTFHSNSQSINWSITWQEPVAEYLEHNWVFAL